MNYNYENGENINAEDEQPEMPEVTAEDSPERVSPVVNILSGDTEEEPEQPVSFIERIRREAAANEDVTEEDWQEAQYNEVRKSGEPVYTPGLSQSAFYAPPKRETPRREVIETFEEKPRRRGGFARALCLIVVCALVSTAASVGVVNYGLRNGGFAVPNTQVVLGATPTPDASPLAGTDGLPGGELSAQEIYSLATKQVVCVATEITSANPFFVGGSAYGSGFIASEDGYIITNYHVIETALQYQTAPTVILRDGTSYTAKIVGYEQINDVAVLKIEATGLSPVKLGSNANMQVGDKIYAVGNPRRLDYTMTDGIVSALDREVQTEENEDFTIHMFQISAAVNSGNSGGPVYNDKGEVLGIVTAKYGANGSEGLGFAIPIDDVMTITQDLITKGYVTGRAQLGITVQTMDASTAEYYGTAAGAFIFTVAPGSCADKAGLRPGDIITKLGEKEITTQDELKLAMRDFRAGDTAEIEIFRDGAHKTYTITFDEQIVTQ